jgi:acyl carrier protein
VDIESFLYQTLAESRRNERADVRADLDERGEIDSLEGVELIAAAESHFGITIHDDEITSSACRSIPRLVELISAKLSAA